ncbi:MAG: glutathione S-transferase [Francisella sp.]|jgi:glutathione S-transferase
MIHLYQFPKLAGKDYSCSPFCVKMELYLKAMNLSYENNFSLELNKSPTGKLPFIEEAGRKFADSNLIITHLENENGMSLNDHISKEQNSIGNAFIRLCEDSLYWVGVYARWCDGDNKSWKKEFIESANLPKLMSGLVYGAAKKNITRQLKASGLLALANSEIYSRAEKDLKSISDYLNSREYFFNDKVSLADIVVFSFLQIMSDGSCGQKLQYLVEQLDFSNFMTAMRNNFME